MKIENLSTADIIANYYKPTLGSMRYSLAGVSARVGPGLLIDEPLIRARIDRALASSEEAADLQFQWMSKQRLEPLRRQGVMNADNVVDRAISALYDAADTPRKLSPTNPRHQDAEALLSQLMPLGPGVITSLRFEDEHSAVNVMLRRLDTEFLPIVQRLSLEPYIEELREANQIYARELSSLDNTGITHAQVTDASQIAKDDFFAVILTVWALFLDDKPLRNQILAPIHEQNERLRLYYQNRKKTPRVDPGSGEILDDNENTTSEAELILNRQLPDLSAMPTPEAQPTA